MPAEPFPVGTGPRAPCYLITGYPGFLAYRVLRELLATQPLARAYLVVPSHRPKPHLASLDEFPEEQRERVSVLEGQTWHLDMGLSGAEYRTLAAQLTHIQHCHQAVAIGTDRELAEQVHVGGMREVLELSRASPRIESIVVHSSALVSGDRRCLVSEDELNAGQTFANASQATLARAERMARTAMAELPVMVARSTHVVGDASTGETGDLDGVYVLLLWLLSAREALHTSELEPLLGAPLDLIPIDYLVKAALYLGTRPVAARHTYHLANPRPPSIRRVAELIAKSALRFYPRLSVSAATVRAFLSAPAARLVGRGPKALLATFATWARYDTEHADAMLRPGHLLCPSLETYVDVLTTHLLTRVLGQLPKAVVPETEAGGA